MEEVQENARQAADMIGVLDFVTPRPGRAGRGVLRDVDGLSLWQGCRWVAYRRSGADAGHRGWSRWSRTW
jgi:hypothetical protein